MDIGIFVLQLIPGERFFSLYVEKKYIKSHGTGLVVKVLSSSLWPFKHGKLFQRKIMGDLINAQHCRLALATPGLFKM